MSNLDFSPQGYKIDKELGRNPAGGRTTYLARDIQHDVPVIIKHFQFAELGTSWKGYEAHQREIELLQKLYHPLIPRYLADFETPNGFCLVQEYKPALSLAQRRHFTPEEIKEIVIGVLEILVYLQDQTPPIFHGDIKPENILVDRTGVIKVYLVDFGFAHQSYSREVSSVAKGTLGFMPPEQILKHPLTPASDLYSLGATLICLLTGIKSEDIGQLIDETYNFKLDSLKSIVNKRFIDWLKKMVAPQIKNRFANAAVALQALKAISVVSNHSYIGQIIHRIPLKILPPLIGLFTLSFAAAIGNILTPNPTPPPPEMVFNIDGIESNYDLIDRLLVTRQCENCDLQGLELRGADLQGAVLHLSDLSYADLQGVRLEGAILRLTNFQGAKLQGANFQGAYPQKANFAQANLEGTNFQGANLLDADFKQANLQGSSLRGADLRNANLEEANLKGTSLQDANLGNSYLANAFLDNANLSGANLDNANLEFAYLNSTYLQDTSLQNADLNNAHLQDANLSRANLTGVNLRGADLRNAQLRDTNLSGANLTGADLRGADLTGAIMPDGAKFIQ